MLFHFKYWNLARVNFPSHKRSFWFFKSCPLSRLFVYSVIKSANTFTIIIWYWIFQARFYKGIFSYFQLNFTTSSELLRFLIMIFSDRRRFDWLSGRNDSFNKIDVQVCSLHIFKVCLENLEKSAEFMLNFESQGKEILNNNCLTSLQFFSCLVKTSKVTHNQT